MMSNETIFEAHAIDWVYLRATPRFNGIEHKSKLIKSQLQPAEYRPPQKKC